MVSGPQLKHAHVRLRSTTLRIRLRQLRTYIGISH